LFKFEYNKPTFTTFKNLKDAFSGCSNINHIICKSSSPDVFALGAFPSNSLTTLYVPSSNNEWIFNNQIVFDQIEYFKKDNEYYSGKYIGWVKESKGTARIVRCVPNTTIESLLVSDKIESNVRTYDLGSIGVSAFTNNSKIKKITLPNTLTGIGDKAFNGFSSLKDIEIEAPPFKINSNVFPNNYSVFSLFVPQNTTSAYLGKDGWKNFKNIEEMVPSAIHDVNTREDDVKIIDIFDSNGSKISNLRKGINIVKYNNGKIKKVLK
jgi:hypothetical protein